MADHNQLTQALKDARLTEAAQLDAVLNLRDAKALRLEVLRTTVLPTLADHPEARRLFDLNVQPGAQPRLWLDLISSVVMEPDPRTYRLVQDHDGARDTVFETSKLEQMAEFTTRYLAHRMVAHDRTATRNAGAVGGKADGYSLAALVYVWVTGCAFGVLGLLAIAISLGKLHF